MNIPDNVDSFLKRQSIVIVSTIDEKNNIYSSVKGIVGIEKEPIGKIVIVDLFKGNTYKNIQNNHKVSVTAIDENDFLGYTIQGKAKIIPREEISSIIVSKLENNIINRVANRMIKSLQSGVKSSCHHEIKLPSKPEYLIEIDVENIIDISPPNK